jgi:hypothetical protein
MEGVKELITYLNRTIPSVEQHFDQGNGSFMNDVQRLARLLAPIDTGRLRDSIGLSGTIKRGATKQLKLIVNSPYGIFQEFGFEPHAFLTDPGRPGFATNKLPLGQVVYVKKWTPFIQPAIEKMLRTYDTKLNSRMNRAIK